MPAWCLGGFLTLWIILAWSPLDRATWVLENILTFVFVPLLIFTRRRFRFSDRAYVQGLLFLALHTVGSHYSYALVPAGDYLREALRLGRNHYDRVVHFAFGLLALGPMREIAFHRAQHTGRFAQLSLSVASVMFFATSYEVVEWIVARLVAPHEGVAFLGTQGDEWDAQKDLVLAFAGALLASAWEAWTLHRKGRHDD